MSDETLRSRATARRRLGPPSILLYIIRGCGFAIAGLGIYFGAFDQNWYAKFTAIGMGVVGALLVFFMPALVYRLWASLSIQGLAQPKPVKAGGIERFWHEVTTEDGRIALDGRPLHTPVGHVLRLPSPARAEAVAREWRAVEGTVNPAVMPMTGFANAAIDRVRPDIAAFAAGVAAYGRHDLLCYRVAHPQALVDRQKQLWDPLLEWAEGHYGIHFRHGHALTPVPQSPETEARLQAVVGGLDPWRLAGLSQLVAVSGSLIIGLAVLEGRLDAENGFAVAQLDSLYQAEQWGEDEEAQRHRAAQATQFAQAARWTRLDSGTD